MARVGGQWVRTVAGYIKTAAVGGANILVNGTNRYINFNLTSGASGYGIRDNNGTMEFKNSGGSWTEFGTGGTGGGISTEQAVDAVAAQIAAGTHVGISITYDDAGNAISFELTGEEFTTAMKDKVDYLTVSAATDLDAIRTKLAGIEANAKDDQTGAEIKALYEAEANTNALTDAEKAILGFLSVTQAVDLDQMETDIAALANGMVYAGDWDASSGSFPSGANTGSFYYVSVAGTVDGVEFAVGDNIVATTDGASTTTYAANWSKHDQTDAVQAVVGLTGSISKTALLAALNVSDGADVTEDAIHGAAAKSTPVDADTFAMIDSAASNVLKKVTWANIKATLFGGFTMTGDINMNGNNITDVHELNLDAKPDTNETANGFVTSSYNAGETVTAFAVLSMKSDGELHYADANEVGTVDRAFIAISLEAGTDGNPIKVALPCSVIRNDSWNWTVGGAIYVGTTAGELTQTAPSTTDDEVRAIGVATSADEMYVFPTVGLVHA